MNCDADFARPYTWQNNRSGLHAASERNHADTSTANTSRPSGNRGKLMLANSFRIRSTSMRPELRPS
jgi:hypothetical protein